jgi:Fe-S-cluster containining protein
VTFSREIIQQLLVEATNQRSALLEAYAHLPPTRCRRQAYCCSLLPEMNLLEALSAIQQVLETKPEQRSWMNKRLIRYFLLNPVEIRSCPFLQDNSCLIYPTRFFGCRAYGLWSEEYYRKKAEQSRQVKTLNQRQWQRLGVSLPREVVDFNLDYCPYVEWDGNTEVDDTSLLNTFDTIENLSAQLLPWHNTFHHQYFSDLSFLLASVLFGLQRAVQLKFEVVRYVLLTGDKGRVDQLIDEHDDFLANLVG